MDTAEFFKDLYISEIKTQDNNDLLKDLFPSAHWLEKTTLFKDRQVTEPAFIPPEKKEIITSLNKLVESTESKEIKFKGGSLLKTYSDILDGEETTSAKESDSIFIGETSESEIGQASIDILFIGKRLEEEEEASELLSKMIAAMKISEESYFVWQEIEAINSSKGPLFKLILEKRPKFIVTLGGLSTNFIFNKKERLQTVHGKFFPRSLKYAGDKEVKFEIFPLFHPDYLLINPKMKRTAWNDLQTLMGRLS